MTDDDLTRMRAQADQQIATYDRMLELMVTSAAKVQKQAGERTDAVSITVSMFDQNPKWNDPQLLKGLLAVATHRLAEQAAKDV